MVARVLSRLERRAAWGAGGCRSPIPSRGTVRGVPCRRLPFHARARSPASTRGRRRAVTGPRRPLLGGLALLVVALVLSMLPGEMAGTAGGALLGLFLPGYALMLCLGTPGRLDRLPDILDSVAASLAITPLALRLAGELLPFDRLHVLGVLIGVTLGFLVLGGLRPRLAVAPPPRRTPLAVLLIVVVSPFVFAATLGLGSAPEGRGGVGKG